MSSISSISSISSMISAMNYIGGGWDGLLEEERQKPYFSELMEFLRREYAERTVYPPQEDIFNALRYTPYDSVKAVIIGQDPYHGKGQAHGLCFSVRKGCEAPPSLKNIFKELQSDLNIAPPTHGELTSWAKQGVLLLNTVLTVREGLPNSHRGMGWERFTDEIIRMVNRKETPTAFILWGANARAKEKLITNPIHAVFSSAHPSPLSAYNGFFGSRCFSRVNAFLSGNDVVPIDWSIE